MDHVSQMRRYAFRVFLALVVVFTGSFAREARANFPAQQVVDSVCYSGSSTSYACMGPMFGSAQSAAEYAAQQQYKAPYWGGWSVTQLASCPAGGSAGLNAHGTYAWSYRIQATNPYGSADLQVPCSSAQVQAMPQCTGGAPIYGFAPATCTGQPSNPPGAACTTTLNIIISAFHPLPQTNIGCYAGCSYDRVTASDVTYNGVAYESGSWKGVGSSCAPSDVALFGGSPGNSSSQITGPGAGAVDYAKLAQETTLQSLLAAVQAGGAGSGSGGSGSEALLQQIASNTATIAAAGNTPPPSDPDNLESFYQEKIAQFSTGENGALSPAVVNATSVDVGSTFSNVNGFLPGQCPANPSFSFRGTTYTMSMGSFCQIAEALGYFIVVMASIAGVKIFMGGIQS